MARGGIITDLDFEGFSTRDLADSSLQTWVHHSPAILPQVRTSLFANVGAGGDLSREM